MEDPLIIENAIRRFYSTGENEAHQWLLQFQNSDAAWDYVWLLLNPAKAYEVQFFAAHTLYAKISKQWFLIPETQQNYIKTQLVTLVKQENLHKAIVSSLCQSVSALLAHLNSVEKVDSSSVLIDDLVQIFPYNNPVSLQYLLKTLTHIPSEVEKKYGAEKAKLRSSLVNSWSKILWLLMQVFTSCNGPVKEENSNNLYILALECVSLWLNVSQFPIEVTEQIYPVLLQSCDRYLPSKQEDDESSKGFDLAQDCLTTIVTNRELKKLPSMLWKWGKALVSLVNDQNARFYYELITVFAEAHSRTLLLSLIESNLEHKQVTEKLIEYCLKCSGEEGRYPTDERYSVLPTGFWYSLQDDVDSLDKPQDAQALEALKPIYARLMMVLLRKSELPLTPEEAGNADEREMFRCYRQDIADSYVYCHRVLGSDFLLLVGQRLSAPVQGERHWVFVESSIFAFTSVSECVWSIETNYLEAILDLILTKIQYENYPDEVLSSACSAIRSLADWIGGHINPWMERCLRLLGRGLTKSPVTSPAASMALIDIVRECGRELAPIAPTILDTINRSIRILSPASDKGEGYRLMYTAGSLIGHMTNRELQLHYLELILGFVILKLKQTIEESPKFELCLKNQFKMIGTFVSHLPSPIVKTVMEVIMPVYESSIYNVALMENSVVVGSMLESMHQCAVSVATNEQEAEALARLLREAYKKRPHPRAFQVLIILMNIHSRTKNPIIGQVFVEMCTLTLGGANACVATGGSLSELCDILHAFFNMLGHMGKKYPDVLYDIPEQFTQMVQLAIMCLSLPETLAVQASAYLLTVVINSKRDLLIRVIINLGQELVSTILHCIAEKVILNHLQPHADVLIMLNKKIPQELGRWTRNAIYSPSSPQISDADKEAFIQMVVRHHTKVSLFESIKNFGMICRQTKVGLMHR